ncbi:MAG: hypothetical protein AAF600_19555 [Bacteroidota bacterium]
MKKRKNSLVIALLILVGCSAQKATDLSIDFEEWASETRSFLKSACVFKDEKIDPALALGESFIYSSSEQIEFYLNHRELIVDWIKSEKLNKVEGKIYVIERYENFPEFIVSLNGNEYYSVKFKKWGSNSTDVLYNIAKSNYSDWFKLQEGESMCTLKTADQISGLSIVSTITLNRQYESASFDLVSITII